MEFDWGHLLIDRLLPKLQLEDLQSLRSVSIGLRQTVRRLPEATWLALAGPAACRSAAWPAGAKPARYEFILLCRARIPEEHPLCNGTATGSVCQQAGRLALLHSRLRTGQPSQAGSFVMQSNVHRGFMADINP